MKTIVRAAAFAALLAGCSQTGEETQDHSGMDHAVHSGSAPQLNASQQAYAQVNQRMHAAMADIPADADVAFMQGMLAHHRGAVEMAQVALDHGTDAQARDLAQRIIAAQQAEIDEMEAWLAARKAAIQEE